MPQTKEIDRAKRAYNCVIAVKDTQFEDKYSSYVKSAPTMILSNGLGQSLAFWKSKAASRSIEAQAYQTLLSNLDENVQIISNQGQLFDAVINRFDHSQYKLAAKEALAFLAWLKRFASSELKSEDK